MFGFVSALLAGGRGEERREGVISGCENGRRHGGEKKERNPQKTRSESSRFKNVFGEAQSANKELQYTVTKSTVPW